MTSTEMPGVLESGPSGELTASGAPPFETTLTVIGAGPAGLAAAVAAADAGMTVTLIESARQIGGQYWRHRPAGPAADADLHHDLDVFAELSAQLDRHVAAGRVTVLTAHQVWAITVDGQECTAQLIDRRDHRAPAEITVTSACLVLAVGAYDRQVPFPGWTLPGVMTVGGAQSLLKGSGVAVGPRVLVAGTGPFLLPVAAGLAARGSTVIGVHEANRSSRWLRHPEAFPVMAGKLGELAGYAAALVRHRVRVHQRSVVVAAHGTERLESVTVARLDRAGAVRPGTRRRVEVDVLAVGYGFTAQSELPLQAGCLLHTTAEQSLAVTVDSRQATSNARVFAAGEITGIGGAQLAVAEGTLAGAAVAERAGLSTSAGKSSSAGTVRRLRRFAAAMHAVHPVPDAWLDELSPDTIVCRCEEVSVAEIDAAIELGARDARTVKLLSRSGMGWCQGRECAYATACLTARRLGDTPDLASGADRPVAAPIPLGVLAGSAGRRPAAPPQTHPPDHPPTH